MSRRPCLLLLLALAVLASCRGSAGPPVAEFDMKDLPAPSMFEELARGLRRPYLLELPARSVDARHSLHLKGVAEEDVLVEIVKLDPSFQFERREGVILLYPAGKEAEQSPYSKTIAAFSAKGGAADVVHQLVVAGALPGDMQIQSPTAGARRPVNVDIKAGTVRDALAQVAVQAHLSMRIEPGTIRLEPVPE